MAVGACCPGGACRRHLQRPAAHRGLLLANGENIVDHEASTTARTGIIPVQRLPAKDVVRRERCLAESGRYNGVMADYLRWLLERGFAPLIGQRLAYDVTLIPTLLLRLYEQAEQVGRKDLQTRCLDSWDGLLRARVGGGRDLLVSLDR